MTNTSTPERAQARAGGRPKRMCARAGRGCHGCPSSMLSGHGNPSSVLSGRQIEAEGE